MKTVLLVAFFALAVHGKDVKDEIQEDTPAIPSDEKDLKDSPALFEDSPNENDSLKMKIKKTKKTKWNQTVKKAIHYSFKLLNYF